LLNAAKAIAAMSGRDFVIPDDIVYVAPPVLRHRLLLTPDKEMEGVTADDVIKQVIHSIEIPR
jgi:MoxR-like ATPase